MLKSNIRLAAWHERFLAWIIDVLTAGVVIGAVSFALIDGPSFGGPETLIGFSGYDVSLVAALGMMIYWGVLEGFVGQTLGKRVLNIKTTDMDGQKAGFLSGMLSGFGKSFLLPIDVLIGLLAWRQDRQRLFNWLGHTTVVKVHAEVTYDR